MAAPPAAPREAAPLVDTHAHLTDPRYAADLDAVLGRAGAAGVCAIVVVGYDLPSSRAAVGLAERYAELWAAVGIHPHNAVSADRPALDELARLSEHPRVVAVGETGLDYYRDLAPREAQLAAFRAQLDLAGRRQLPVVVHSRDAMGETLETLEAHLPASGGVMHCFDGAAADATRAVSLGLYLSCAGPITYRRDQTLAAAIAAVPESRLVLETDCPYLSPRGHRGERNEPARVGIVAEAVAAARGVTVERIARVTTGNAARLLRTPALAATPEYAA